MKVVNEVIESWIQFRVMTGCYSTVEVGGQHYGSVASSKDVIMMNVLNIVQHGGGRHRRTPSEVSAVSQMSAMSVDTSI